MLSTVPNVEHNLFAGPSAYLAGPTSTSEGPRGRSIYQTLALCGSRVPSTRDDGLDRQAWLKLKTFKYPSFHSIFNFKTSASARSHTTPPHTTPVSLPSSARARSPVIGSPFSVFVWHLCERGCFCVAEIPLKAVDGGFGSGTEYDSGGGR